MKIYYKSVYLFVFISLFSLELNAQNELMKIDGKKITDTEFYRLFLKNRVEKSSPTEAEVDEYLKLFINFKLKVAEAEAQGYDTLSSFKKELAGYRSQLTRPYFSDNNVIDSLVRQAYDRMKTEVHSRHILIRLNPGAPPEDTLRAYEKAMSIRAQIIVGNRFEQIAKEFSDDPSATANGGDLGYFTALQMVYPFENAAYTIPIDSISYPVRTRFGYHLIQTLDKREARGKVKVAHIMKLVPKSATIAQKKEAKEKIDSLYQLLKNGADFTVLAQKYSDDHASGTNGGELPWFGTGRMIPTFENAAFNIKNVGNFTKPIKTSFGWHIIKLIDKKGLKPFDEMKAELYAKVKKDSRAELSKTIVLNKLKKEYNFKDENKLGLFYANIDTTYFEGEGDISLVPQHEQTMFSYANKNYTVLEFANYLYKNQPHRGYANSNLISYISNSYNKYTENELLKYEDTQLERKYPDFFYLMKEYHDGILLFNITDKEVWSKSMKDSIGLKKYFAKNKDKYIEEPEVNLSIFSYKWSKLPKKWRKIKKNFDFSKSTPDSSILLIFNIYDKEFTMDTSSVFKLSDSILSTTNLNKSQLTKKYNFYFNKIAKKVYYVRDFQKEKTKELNQIKSIVASDYQKQLEDAWIESLQKKHKLEINETNYKIIKNNILYPKN